VDADCVEAAGDLDEALDPHAAAETTIAIIASAHR
jgi:hypothetical protein